MRHHIKNINYTKKYRLEALAFAAKGPGVKLSERDTSPPGLQPEHIATNG